jgi:hypothetical protein
MGVLRTTGLLVATAVVLAGAGVRAAPTSMVVFPMQGGKTVNKKVTSALTDELLEAVRKAKGAEVITAQEAAQRLGFSPVQAARDCGSDALCLAQIGTALGVSKLVLGRVNRDKEGPYKIELLVVDVLRSTLESRKAFDVDGSPREIKTAVRLQAYDSLGISGEGRVTLTGLPAGAEVLVDGKPEPGPWANRTHRSGTFPLAVRAVGFEPWEGRLDVDIDEAVTVKVELVPAAPGLAAVAPEPSLEAPALVPPKAEPPAKPAGREEGDEMADLEADSERAAQRVASARKSAPPAPKPSPAVAKAPPPPAMNSTLAMVALRRASAYGPVSMVVW